MASARTKRLSELGSALQDKQIRGAGDPVISSLVFDSRSAAPGSLFVAMRGLKADGARFIQDAIARGAVAVVAERGSVADPAVPVVEVPDVRKALAELAWAFYDHPERHLTCTGITGTNGKSTTATVLRSVLEHAGRNTGIVGTLGIQYNDFAEDSPRTTPESVDLARHFAAMLESGISHVVMEATSIGIDLERTWGIPFRVTVFTNLTRDHLDYHGTENAYLAAKLRLFSEQPDRGVAVINRDDPASDHFIRGARGIVRTYGVHQGADYRATDLALTPQATRFNLRTAAGQFAVEAPLLGEFNVYNLLAVLAAADALGLHLEQTVESLQRAAVVRGRAERVSSSAPFSVVVDYAHTPDALEKILTTLRALNPLRVLTVVGAGGDRDKGKRPLMAATAYKMSDLLFLTSDNPRSEDPAAILDDMAAGLPQDARAYRNPDRRAAIADALSDAKPGDIVLIAGKGHETYQEICGVKHPFDDRQVALDWLHARGYGK